LRKIVLKLRSSYDGKTVPAGLFPDGSALVVLIMAAKPDACLIAPLECAVELQIDDALRFATRWANSKHALITPLTHEVNEVAISRPAGSLGNLPITRLSRR
jgi:hypothetical protein